MKKLYFIVSFLCVCFSKLIAQETVTTYTIPNVLGLTTETKTHYLPTGQKMFNVKFAPVDTRSKVEAEDSLLIISNPNKASKLILFAEKGKDIIKQFDKILTHNYLKDPKTMAKDDEFVIEITFSRKNKQENKGNTPQIQYKLVIKGEQENISEIIKKTILEIASKEADKKSNVGKFTLKKSFKIEKEVEDKEKKETKKIKKEYIVEKATINILQGVIVDLRVYVSEKGSDEKHILKFRKKRLKMFISLTNYDQYLEDELMTDDGKIKVPLRDILNYESRDGFVPEESYLEITPEESINTRLNTNLASFVDVKIFSDALGVVSEKPNGLIQGELSSKIFLITRGLWKSRTTALNYLHFGAGLAKFDSKFDSTQVDSLAINFKDRMSFWQRSNQNIYFKLNLLSVFLGRKSFIDLNIGVDWTQSRVIHKNKDFNAQLGSWTGELLFRTKANDNFGINLSFMYMAQKVIGNAGFTNTDKVDDWKNMGIASAELHYYPMEKSDDAIYLRARYFTTFKEPEVGNFMQLQLGYKINFNYKNKK